MVGHARFAFRSLMPAAIAFAAIGCGDHAATHTPTPADSGWDGGPVCGRCDDAGKDARIDALDGALDGDAASLGDGGASNADAGSDGPACNDCGACEERMLAIGSAKHAEGDIDYKDDPPAGGAHNPCWAEWGAHTDEVRPENWVHNLEHGGVVLLYWCPDGCADTIAELTKFADTHERALLTPYRDLQTRFAYVSWGYRLLTNCDDTALVRMFYDAHVGRGPEDATSGPPAVCR